LNKTEELPVWLIDEIARESITSSSHIAPVTSQIKLIKINHIRGITIISAESNVSAGIPAHGRRNKAQLKGLKPLRYNKTAIDN
jgi:hypothetical protein